MKPTGLVVLPSPWLDECDDEWIEAIGRAPAVAVNLATVSERLLAAGCRPRNAVILDNPRHWFKRARDRAGIEALYHDDSLVIWGGYDYWARKYRLWQAKDTNDSKMHLPRWIGPDEFFCREDDAFVILVAGHYSSAAACNVMAHLLGWECRILVLGNTCEGGYCRTRLERYLDRSGVEVLRRVEKRARVPAADRHQWKHLERGALATGTEIVHVEPTACNDVERITSDEALSWLN